MRSQRVTTAVGFALLFVVTLAVAEASLGGLLALFAVVLKLNLAVEVGSTMLNLWRPNVMGIDPDVTLHDGAVVASLVFTALCGLLAASRRFLPWDSHEELS